MLDNKRNYLLAIKRNNNDYLPLEWNLTSSYDNEELTTIEGIDAFTSKITRISLLTDALALNIIDLEEKYKSFVIIYYEKGKTRELKEGPVFQEDEIDLSVDNFLETIIANIEDKNFLNDLKNACYTKNPEPELIKFDYILKNLAYFISKGPNAIYAALLTFHDLSYERKRTIIIKLSKKMTKNKEQSPTLLKTDSPQIEGKVA